MAVFEIIMMCGQVCEKEKNEKEKGVKRVDFVRKDRTIEVFFQQLLVFDFCTIFKTRQNFSTVQKVCQPFSGQFLLLSFTV